MKTITIAVVALLAAPVPLKMIENIIHRDMFQYETEAGDYRQESPLLEHKLQPIWIQPLNLDPERLLGDQFVMMVDKIERRATTINAIF